MVWKTGIVLALCTKLIVVSGPISRYGVKGDNYIIINNVGHCMLGLETQRGKNGRRCRFTIETTQIQLNIWFVFVSKSKYYYFPLSTASQKPCPSSTNNRNDNSIYIMHSLDNGENTWWCENTWWWPRTLIVCIFDYVPCGFRWEVPEGKCNGHIQTAR